MAEQTNVITRERNRVFGRYVDKKRPFRVETKPHKSMRPIFWRVTGAAYPGAGMAWAVMDKGQILEFFTYGQGDNIPDGFGGTRTATAAETDLSEGGKTTGAETFVIEGISASGSAIRNKQASGSETTPPDQAITDAYAGLVSIADPAALVVVPQVYSPFNLEAVLLTAAAPAISVELEWDRTRKTQVGTLDEIGEGGPKSFLRANGEPHPSNLFKVPEGYVWRPAGATDSNFLVRLQVQRTVVVPISLVTPPGGASPIVPVGICLDLALRLHGLRFMYPSAN